MVARAAGVEWVKRVSLPGADDGNGLLLVLRLTELLRVVAVAQPTVRRGCHPPDNSDQHAFEVLIVVDKCRRAALHVSFLPGRLAIEQRIVQRIRGGEPATCSRQGASREHARGAARTATPRCHSADASERGALQECVLHRSQATTNPC